MFRPTVRGLVAVVLGAGLLFVETPIHSPGQVQAGKIRVSAMSLVYKPNKNPITVIPVSAKAAANRPTGNTRTYRGRRVNKTASTGRRYSYNYSGVGFPGMEGGLTAAANRSTWLKKP